MNKKYSALSVAAALALSGCGSDSSESDQTNSIPTTYTVTALDGYLGMANVYTGDDCSNFVGQTEGNGQIVLSTKYQDQRICIVAIPGVTVDSNRGVVDEGFTLAAPAGYDVVNPMTDMVVDIMDASGIPDTSEALKDAENQVVAAIAVTGGLVDVTSEDIFGDYLNVDGDTTAEEQEIADALNVVGEVLVNNHVISVEAKLDVTESVSQKVQTVISSTAENETADLSGFSPKVTLDVAQDGTATVSVEANYAPTVIEGKEITSLGEYEVDGELETIDISSLFEDKDSDPMVFSSPTFTDNGDYSGLVFNGSTLTGSPTLAGDYVFEFYATDVNGARSYPAEISFTVLAENVIPVVSNSIKSAKQAELDALNITPIANSPVADIVHNIDLGGLFSDADSDPLIYSLDPALVSAIGLDIKISDEGLLTITRGQIHNASLKIGNYPLKVIANDGANVPVLALLNLVVSKEADSDDDGIVDSIDVFPADPAESKDSDSDGVGDNADAFPNDATETKDTDGDGTGDNLDIFPTDPTETEDTDGDGTGDNLDIFPTDPTETKDTDGDGTGDNSDVFPTDPTETKDTDGDGIGDNADQTKHLSFTSKSALFKAKGEFIDGFNQTAISGNEVVDVTSSDSQVFTLNSSTQDKLIVSGSLTIK